MEHEADSIRLGLQGISMFRTDLNSSAAAEAIPPSETSLPSLTEHLQVNRATVLTPAIYPLNSEHKPRVKAVPDRVELAQIDREALYADFQPLVRRLIHQYGETPELRQDLAGEIYCRFCDLLAAYDPSRRIPLRPYLVRTLTAAVYTYSRSQWRRQHREVSLQSETDVESSGDHVDPSHQWVRELITKDVLAVLPSLIAKLPQRQRQVVIARYYEARSFEEIAEQLRIRPATARSLLRHGLNNLRNMISTTHLGEW